MKFLQELQHILETPGRVHSVPKGTMPKAELTAHGKSVIDNDTAEDRRRREGWENSDDPFAYPGDDIAFGKCNYDKRIKRLGKGENIDPEYLRDLMSFAFEHNGKLYIFSRGKKNGEAIGDIKVVGRTVKQNPLTEIWHDAETVEVRINGGVIVPATRLSPNHNVVQDFRFKAYVPSGWEKVVQTIKAASNR